MELGESLALADRFALSLLFKVHSLPRNERTETGRLWWRTIETRLGPGPALTEHRRQIETFAALRQVDRARDRQIFLTLSAIVEDEHDGKCPALIDNGCSIYEDRPLTCRTVPLHYSRPPSTLASYLDGFVGKPGYACETSDAPEVLKGNDILSVEVREARDAAVQVAGRDRAWKAALVEQMSDASSAKAAGLPTFADVVANSDRGYASMVPMLVAWRAAAYAGLMTQDAFADLCRKQIGLMERAIESRQEREAVFSERIRLYRSAIAGLSSEDVMASDPRPSIPGPSLVF